MQTRIKSSLLVAGLAICAATSLPAQSKPAQLWNLPQGTTVKDSGPRTYKFSVDYNTANTKGELVYRQRVTGEYTRGLARRRRDVEERDHGERGWTHGAVRYASEERLHGGISLPQ